MLCFMTTCDGFMVTVSIVWDDDRADFSMKIEQHFEGNSELLYSDSYRPIRPGPLRGGRRLCEILNKLGIRIPETAFQRLQHWEATKPSASGQSIAQVGNNIPKIQIALTRENTA